MSETRIVKKKSKTALKIALLVANFLVIGALGFGTVHYYLKYTDFQNTHLSSDERISVYEGQISKTYTLPANDSPTLADVKNAATLKKDPTNGEFFKDAVDGDVLLVYSKSKLGILYRPTTKKIIKAGPVAFKQQVQVSLVGAAADRAKVAALLKKDFANDAAVAGEQDAKAALTTTTIVDVTGKNADLASKLASELKGSIGNVPEGQPAPPAGTGIVVYIAAEGSGLSSGTGNISNTGTAGTTYSGANN